MDKAILPADFDGTFKFTNWTDEDFTGKWNNRAYTFKALTTSPMIIIDATPLEIQHIRKKFAKELAEREFNSSAKMAQLQSIERANNAPALNSFRQANTYSTDDLAVYTQRALEPLSVAPATITVLPPIDIEDKLVKNKRGRPVTRAVDSDESLEEAARANTVQ